jgi:hypothetical protein
MIRRICSMLIGGVIAATAALPNGLGLNNAATVSAANPAFTLPNILSLYPSGKLLAARAVFTLDGTTRNLVRVRALDSAGTGGTEYDLASGADGWISDSAATTAYNASTNATKDLAVTTVYDQTGNGYHATQTTVAEQPRLRKNPVTSHWEIVMGNTNGNYTRWLKVLDPMVNNDCSFFHICRSYNDYPGSADWADIPSVGWVKAANNVENFLHFNTTAGGLLRYSYYSYANYVGGMPRFNSWDARPQLMNFNRSSGSLRIVRLPDINATATSGYNADASTAVYGGWGRHGTTNDGGRSGVAYALLSGSSLDTTQSSTISTALTSYVIGAHPTAGVLWQGDSMSRGYIAGASNDPDRGIAIRLQGALGDTYTVRASCLEGVTITSLETYAATNRDPYKETMARGHMAILFAGYNDQFAGASAATIYSRITTWVTNRKAAGWTKVCVCTLPTPSGLSAVQSTYDTLNASIRGNAAGADAIIDLEGLGGWTVGSGYIQAYDSLHLTPSGAQRAATLAASVILSVF